jgi:hypothetical protein
MIHSNDTTELLKKSLDNKLNIAIYNLTFADIVNMKRSILDEVVHKSKIKAYLLEKLKPYRYIDDLNDLRDGAYIRWLSISPDDDPPYFLNRGAIFCNVSITKEGISLICKAITNGRYFLLKQVDRYVFFQKLSYQELLILQAIDMVNYKST